METIPFQLREDYIAYKDKVISHYNQLLELNKSKSVEIFIEHLKGIELLHKEEILTNQAVPELSIDLGHSIALTPTNELGQLSLAIAQITDLRNDALNQHFSNPHMDQLQHEHLNKIRKLETEIFSKLLIRPE